MENTAAVSGDAGIYEEYPGEEGGIWTSIDRDDVFKWFGFLGGGGVEIIVQRLYDTI